ncbi:hypothetical protein J3R30DRAFT_3523229, partial [Lentinula aciculospora]
KPKLKFISDRNNDYIRFIDIFFSLIISYSHTTSLVPLHPPRPPSPPRSLHFLIPVHLIQGSSLEKLSAHLVFLAALIFLGCSSDCTENNSKIPGYCRTFVQTSAPGNGNGHGVILTPVVVTPYNSPASTQRIASWVRRLYRPSKYLDEADMKEVNIDQDSDTTRSM